jgi:hypothetical protein
MGDNVQVFDFATRGSQTPSHARKTSSLVWGSLPAPLRVVPTGDNDFGILVALSEGLLAMSVKKTTISKTPKKGREAFHYPWA